MSPPTTLELVKAGVAAAAPKPPKAAAYGPHNVKVGDAATYLHPSGQAVQGIVASIGHEAVFVKHGARQKAQLGPAAVVKYADLQDVGSTAPVPPPHHLVAALKALPPEHLQAVLKELGIRHHPGAKAAPGGLPGQEDKEVQHPGSKGGKWYWTKSHHIRYGTPPGPDHPAIESLGPEHLSPGAAVAFETPEGKTLAGEVVGYGPMGAQVHVQGAAGDVTHKVPYHAIRTVTPQAEEGQAPVEPATPPKKQFVSLEKGDLVTAQVKGNTITGSVIEADEKHVHMVDVHGVYMMVPVGLVIDVKPGEGLALEHALAKKAAKPAPALKEPEPGPAAGLQPGDTVNIGDTVTYKGGKAVVTEFSKSGPLMVHAVVTESESLTAGARIQLEPSEILAAEKPGAPKPVAAATQKPTPQALGNLQVGDTVQFAMAKMSGTGEVVDVADGGAYVKTEVGDVLWIPPKAITGIDKAQPATAAAEASAPGPVVGPELKGGPYEHGEDVFVEHDGKVTKGTVKAWDDHGVTVLTADGEIVKKAHADVGLKAAHGVANKKAVAEQAAKEKAEEQAAAEAWAALHGKKLQEQGAAGAKGVGLAVAKPKEEKATPKEPPPFDPAKLSPPPDFLNWGGTGAPGPSSNPEVNAANAAATKAIYEAAKSGDPGKVTALTAAVVAKEGQEAKELPVLEHVSQHVKGYAQQVLEEINDQKHPAEPPMELPEGSSIKVVDEAAPLVPGPFGPGHKRVGYYVDLGKLVIPGNLQEIAPAGHKLTWLNHKLTTGTYAEASKKAYAVMPKTHAQAMQSHKNGSKNSVHGTWAGNLEGAGKAIELGIKHHGHYVQEGTVISRKISVGGMFGPAGLAKFAGLAGHVIQDPGIQSHSIDPSTWSGDVHLKVHFPAGVKAFYVGPYSWSGTHGGEKEMQLPPNSRYYVRQVIANPPKDADGFGDEDAKYLLDVVVLPHHMTDPAMTSAQHEMPAPEPGAAASTSAEPAAMAQLGEHAAAVDAAFKQAKFTKATFQAYMHQAGEKSAHAGLTLGEDFGITKGAVHGYRIINLHTGRALFRISKLGKAKRIAHRLSELDVPWADLPAGKNISSADDLSSHPVLAAAYHALKESGWDPHLQWPAAATLKPLASPAAKKAGQKIGLKKKAAPPPAFAPGHKVTWKTYDGETVTGTVTEPKPAGPNWQPAWGPHVMVHADPGAHGVPTHGPIPVAAKLLTTALAPGWEATPKPTPAAAMPAVGAEPGAWKQQIGQPWSHKTHKITEQPDSFQKKYEWKGKTWDYVGTDEASNLAALSGEHGETALAPGWELTEAAAGIDPSKNAAKLAVVTMLPQYKKAGWTNGVTLAKKGSEAVPVPALHLKGLSVHPKVTTDGVAKKWIVAHQASGLGTGLSFDSKVEAMQVAEKLAGLGVDWTKKTAKELEADKPAWEAMKHAVLALQENPKATIQPVGATTPAPATATAPPPKPGLKKPPAEPSAKPAGQAGAPPKKDWAAWKKKWHPEPLMKPAAAGDTVIATEYPKSKWWSQKPGDEAHYDQEAIHVPWKGGKKVEIPAFVHTEGGYAIHQALQPSKHGPVPTGKWVVAHPKGGTPIPGSGEFETLGQAEQYVKAQHGALSTYVAEKKG